MRKFQDGDIVVHKTDKEQPMTVVGYTSEGEVACRWKEKGSFPSGRFMEAELEKYVHTPAVGFGTVKDSDPNKYKW